jgi:SAM-dependent methyltransferase
MKSQFGKKIFRGETPNDEDWNQYLVEAHQQAPSMTPAAFAPYKTALGLTSYEILAENANRIDHQPTTILDLACGDGYLLQFLLPKLPGSGKLIGIDMSEGELQVAKKNYGHNRQVQFYSAMSQSLPLPDDSIDLMVCHMAFMLMLPIEPAVSEIHRVLKSGGAFSAVIGNARGKQGFLGEILKITLQFIDSRYPQVRETRTGDARVQSEAGLRELFSPARGFLEALDIFDFSLLINTDPQGVWDLMKDMYLISMLPPPDKSELEAELKRFTATKVNANGTVHFEFQMRMFTAKKLTNLSTRTITDNIF